MAHGAKAASNDFSNQYKMCNAEIEQIKLMLDKIKLGYTKTMSDYERTNFSSEWINQLVTAISYILILHAKEVNNFNLSDLLDVYRIDFSKMIGKNKLRECITDSQTLTAFLNFSPKEILRQVIFHICEWAKKQEQYLPDYLLDAFENLLDPHLLVRSLLIELFKPTVITANYKFWKSENKEQDIIKIFDQEIKNCLNKTLLNPDKHPKLYQLKLEMLIQASPQKREIEAHFETLQPR